MLMQMLHGDERNSTIKFDAIKMASGNGTI